VLYIVRRPLLLLGTGSRIRYHLSAAARRSGNIVDILRCRGLRRPPTRQFGEGARPQPADRGENLQGAAACCTGGSRISYVSEEAGVGGNPAAEYDHRHGLGAWPLLFSASIGIPWCISAVHQGHGLD